jgi:hypothetical protein
VAVVVLVLTIVGVGIGGVVGVVLAERITSSSTVSGVVELDQRSTSTRPQAVVTATAARAIVRRLRRRRDIAVTSGRLRRRTQWA